MFHGVSYREGRGYHQPLPARNVIRTRMYVRTRILQGNARSLARAPQPPPPSPTADRRPARPPPRSLRARATLSVGSVHARAKRKSNQTGLVAHTKHTADCCRGVDCSQHTEETGGLGGHTGQARGLNETNRAVVLSGKRRLPGASPGRPPVCFVYMFCLHVLSTCHGLLPVFL